MQKVALCKRFKPFIGKLFDGQMAVNLEGNITKHFIPDPLASTKY